MVGMAMLVENEKRQALACLQPQHFDPAKTTIKIIMNPTNDIETLRKQLGLPAAPMVLDGLETVQKFFKEKLHVSPMAWIPYVKGIDFHHPISVVTLRAPDEVVRHKPEDGKTKPFIYFGKPGLSPMRSGTNFPNVTFERFTFLRGVTALKSIASSVSFGPSDHVVRPGGATQLIISAADFSALVPKSAEQPAPPADKPPA